MIERYEVKEVAQIWSDENKFQKFLEVELALLQTLEEKNCIPSGVAKSIKKRAKINPLRIKEIENITKHDVIAFCTSIAEQVPGEHGRYFHFGVTSSDVIDTATNLQIRQSLEILFKDFEIFEKSLKKLIKRSQDILTVGRSHGMIAEPLILGQKWLGYLSEFKRRVEDYQHFYENDLTGQFSGAVGNFTVLSPEIETLACEKLHLKVEAVSTQIIPRDRHAKLLSLGAQVANFFERLSIEIRHLHRSEVLEVSEGFSKGQKGSSTMPHKKNPIAAENVSGLSRVIRSHALVGFENTLLWHERDISHSSAERMVFPDHFGLLIYITRRMSKTLENLDIHKNTIEQRAENNMGALSSFLLHEMIKSTNYSREQLYEFIQAVFFTLSNDKNLKLEDVMKKKAKERKIDLPKIAIPSKKDLVKHYSHVFKVLQKRL